MSAQSQFQIYVRRLPGYELSLSLKFKVANEMGVIAVRQPGRPEPAASTAAEATELDVGVLQASRFIHIPRGSTRRNSFAFSRLSAEALERLPEGDWVELQPVTEYGFRYLVIAEGAGTPDPARVQIPGTPGMVAANLGAKGATGPQVAPGQPAAKTLVPAGEALPEPPMPVERTLGEAALAGLTREQAINALREELVKCSALFRIVEDLRDRLEASAARERDLLEVLGRWQSREVGSG